jgi:hypothetical protein
MLFSTGQRIVFIGDSVTDCDRRGAVTLTHALGRLPTVPDIAAHLNWLLCHPC